MAPFSVIVFGVVVWTIAVSGAKQLRFRLKTDQCARGLSSSNVKEEGHENSRNHYLKLTSNADADSVILLR